MPEERVIDLDEPDPEPRSVDTSRRRSGFRMVAAFVAGLTLGGAGVFAFREQRPHDVALVVLPALTNGGASDVDGIFHVDGRLSVVNTGSVAVTVRVATGEGAGLMVRQTGPETRIGPGVAGLLAVDLRVVCSVGLRTEQVSMRISAQPTGRDAEEAVYPVPFRNSAWAAEAADGCEIMGR